MTPVLAEVGKVRVYDPDTGLGGLVEIFVQVTITTFSLVNQ